MKGTFERPVLVTGAGGFIGSALVERLVTFGAPVRALLGPATEASSLRRPSPQVRAVVGDIEDEPLLAELLQGVDCVFHLAGPASVAESFEVAARYVRVHAAGTAALLNRVRAKGVPRLVYVSSAEVYDARGLAPGTRVHEDHPRVPRSPYGVAKLAAEILLEQCAGDAIQVSIVRPFSVYGPGCSPHSLIGTLVGAVARGEAQRVVDARPVRDYCYIDDLVDALLNIGLRRETTLRAYNVASGRGISVGEVARALAHVAGRKDVELGASKEDRPLAAMVPELVGDPARALDEFGFRTRTPLEVGLERTLAGCLARSKARVHW